jgi:NADPH:quinone reductase-like Zn-dependent oxidoreductase
VGNPEKVQYLVDDFGVPRNRIFNSRDTSFLRDIMTETNGRGVDVVLNSLSGELLHASWKCVAEFGIMVEIGKRDFIGQAALSMDLFEQNRSFMGVDLTQICTHRPALMNRYFFRVSDFRRIGLY